MRRKEDHPISKHTLNLFAGDYDALQRLYPRIGAAKIIREIVRKHLRLRSEGTLQLTDSVNLDLSHD